MVIDVSKKYLPGLSAGAFDDPRVTVFCGDGMQYMREHTGEFDVIITDSSDPVGPAAALFEQSYFKEMHSALREDGLLCSQGECMWLHIEFIAKMLKSCGTLYPSVDYGYTTIPTYPSGQIGFVLCSKNGSTNFKVPVRGVDTGELRYYTPALHSASFVLPKFADDALRA